MARRIKRARIQFVSLVPAGANRMPVVYKSAERIAEFAAMSKAAPDFDEKGELLAVVYAPDYVDTDGEYASAEVIKEMAYSHMQEGAQIDVRHNGKAVPRDQVYVGESFIIQKDDSRFVDWKDTDGKPVDVTGGWGQVIKIDDPRLRKEYREGKWGGVSMAGPAEIEREKEDKEPVVGLLKSLLKSLGLLKSGRETTDQEIDMEKQELEAVLKERDEKLLGAMKELVSPAVKFEGDLGSPEDVEKHLAKLREQNGQETTAASEKPKIEVEFEGDKSSPEDVQKHLEKVRRAELEAAVDWNDAASVQKYHKELEKLAKGDDEDDGEDDGEDDLEKSRRASRAPATKGEGDDKSDPRFADFDGKLRKEAEEAAGFMRDLNKSRGF